VVVSTKSLWRGHDPVSRLHGAGPTIDGMDILAVFLGIACFAILIALVYAIERI
jgi:hypothetical protein